MSTLYEFQEVLLHGSLILGHTEGMNAHRWFGVARGPPGGHLWIYLHLKKDQFMQSKTTLQRE